jgi:MOSC domain-containing protein YiiM
MADGTVTSIHIAETAGGALKGLDSVRAVAGRGLEGDRYFEKVGTYSDTPGTGREVTLVEAESIEALELEHGVKLGPGESRRNIMTRGVALNHLVGQEFKVGEVTLRGARLCEPCSHLASLTHAKALPGLVHRGGLRADIVEGGVIRLGDSVRLI